MNKVIFQAVWNALLTDPVFAARVICGYELDAFQAVRLRYFWWTRRSMDSSGFSTGKTLVDWLFLALCCILIPNQHCGVFYPYFETGKQSFWKYFRECQHPIFRAQLGGTDEKGDEMELTTRGSACYRAFYRNGSETMMPAPGHIRDDAASQSSLRLNSGLFEEWTHVDAMSDSIDHQLIERVTRPSWNQHHPIWGNHLTFTAPAKTEMHPGATRYRTMRREMEGGDPDVACFNFSYKDYSNLACHTGKSYREQYRIDTILMALKQKLGRAEFMGEGLGIWAKSGKGWFTEEALLACMEMGRQRGLRPVMDRAEG